VSDQGEHKHQRRQSLADSRTALSDSIRKTKCFSSLGRRLGKSAAVGHLDRRAGEHFVELPDADTSLYPSSGSS
jgi:hypothetical protein